MHDPKVQQATILFNDRINTWRLMKALDAELDDKTTTKKIKELAELRIRNLAAFRELQSFNDTGDFIYKHIIIAQYGEHAKLTKLRQDDPQKFMDDYYLAKDNVKRYTTHLKSTKRTAEQKVKDAELLEKWETRCKLFAQVASGE